MKFEFNCRKRRKRECILRGLRPRIGEGEFCSAEACFIFRKFPTRVTDFFGEDVTFVHRSLAYTLSNHFFIFGRRLQAMSVTSSRGIARNTTCSRCDLYVTNICCVMSQPIVPTIGVSLEAAGRSNCRRVEDNVLATRAWFFRSVITPATTHTTHTTHHTPNHK